MDPSDSLWLWVAVWTVTAAVILLAQMRKASLGVGLVAAYVLSLALNHYLGAAIYLQPWYANPNLDADVVAVGFQQSTFAVIGLALGSLVFAPALRGVMHSSAARRWSGTADPRLARMYMVIGAVSLLSLRPLLGRVPTLSAFVAQGWSLLLVGIGLAAWNAWRTRRSLAFSWWLAATLCLPFVTIVLQGFLGYGTLAALAILTFISAFSRPGWKGVVIALVLGYVAMSLYVTYMRDRLAIRNVVWGNSPIDARIARVFQTVSTVEWFDVSNVDHLARIDERMNQNIQVGEAVTYLDAGLARFAYGASVWDGAIALVPRALWPTKPVVAGSGDLVTQYTGIGFAEGTSVGIGNVMEAYISFGIPGVVCAFVLLGMVIATVDAAAGQRLQSGDVRGFVLWYLPGLSMLQVGGSFVELTSSVGAALVIGYLVTRLPSMASPRRGTPIRIQPGLAVTRT